jgi:hypothetical protein
VLVGVAFYSLSHHNRVVLDGQAIVLVGVGFYSLSHHNRVPIPSTTPAVIATGFCCWRAGARPEETTGRLAPGCGN